MATRTNGEWSIGRPVNWVRERPKKASLLSRPSPLRRESGDVRDATGSRDSIDSSGRWEATCHFCGPKKVPDTVQTNQKTA
jgi:hypothetical protein